MLALNFHFDSTEMFVSLTHIQIRHLGMLWRPRVDEESIMNSTVAPSSVRILPFGIAFLLTIKLLNRNLRPSKL